MSTASNPARSHVSQPATVAIAVLVATVAAFGINAVHHKSAHAVHAPAAVMTATPPDVPWAASADALVPTSDPSVPSASEVFRGRTLPDSDEHTATF